ncbi:hypothetical protein RSOL_365450, partial [Rhizoctonia solani AG-3 Rhs1AP]
MPDKRPTALVAVSPPGPVDLQQRLQNCVNERLKEAYEESVALATERAEKRPRDYTLDELEEQIARRRRENESNAEQQRLGTVNYTRPPPPPLPQHAGSGVNLQFVERIRNRTPNIAIGTATPATDQSRFPVVAPPPMTQLTASSHSQHPAPPIASIHPFQALDRDLMLIDDPELYLGPANAYSPPNGNGPTHLLADRLACSPSPSSPPPVTQRSTSLTPLSPNDDPKSSTYGDGPGNLLPPRRLVVRSINREEMKSKSEKERKAAHNQLRARSSDYASLEGRILQTATKEVALAEGCWDWARRFHGKRITHDTGIISLLRRNLVNHRTQVSSTSTELVKDYYKFDRTRYPTEDTKVANTTKANQILKGDGYIFGDPESRDDPYENGLILELGTRLWFDGKHAAGVIHPDLFLQSDSIPLPTLAYILTILEKAIREWVPGFHKSIPLIPDSHRDRLKHHIDEIKKYRDYPGAEDLYKEVVRDLNIAFRNKVKEFAPPSIQGASDTLNGTTNTGNSTSGEPSSGLQHEDIEKALRRRQARRAVNTGGLSGNAPVPAQDMHLNLPLGFVLPFSNTSEAEVSSIGSGGSSVSTIYPEDSVSQQIPVNASDANQSENRVGYLAHLQGPL